MRLSGASKYVRVHATIQMHAHAMVYIRSMTSAAEKALDAIERIHAQAIPAIDRELQRANGIPLAWYRVLAELRPLDSRLTMSELADRVLLSRTRVSRLVDDLERALLVSRQTSDQDRRIAFASLTLEGHRRFLEATPVCEAAIKRAVETSSSLSALEQLSQAIVEILARPENQSRI